MSQNVVDDGAHDTRHSRPLDRHRSSTSHRDRRRHRRRSRSRHSHRSRRRSRSLSHPQSRSRSRSASRNSRSSSNNSSRSSSRTRHRQSNPPRRSGSRPSQWDRDCSPTPSSSHVLESTSAHPPISRITSAAITRSTSFSSLRPSQSASNVPSQRKPELELPPPKSVEPCYVSELEARIVALTAEKKARDLEEKLNEVTYVYLLTHFIAASTSHNFDRNNNKWEVFRYIKWEVMPASIRVSLLHQCPNLITPATYPVKFATETAWDLANRREKNFSITNDSCHRHPPPTKNPLDTLSDNHPENKTLRFCFDSSGEVISEARADKIREITRKLLRSLESINGTPLHFSAMEDACQTWLFSWMEFRIEELRGCQDSWKAKRVVSSIYSNFCREARDKLKGEQAEPVSVENREGAGGNKSRSNGARKRNRQPGTGNTPTTERTKRAHIVSVNYFLNYPILNVSAGPCIKQRSSCRFVRRPASSRRRTSPFQYHCDAVSHSISSRHNINHIAFPF